MSYYELVEDRIKFIQFPKQIGKNNFKYLNYGDKIDCRVIKLPFGDTYSDWYLNNHHFTTKYHTNIVLPLLANLLDFKFNINDFHIIEHKSGKFDISMPFPNHDIVYDIVSYTDNQALRDIKYDDFLHCGNGKVWQPTDYHKIYRYGHQVSKIINKTIGNNRKLLISGDSQMIPSVPVLSVYFNEVAYFDNRDGKHYFEPNETDYTDILFAIGFNDFGKYIDNLK